MVSSSCWHEEEGIRAKYVRRRNKGNGLVIGNFSMALAVVNLRLIKA